jgi:hypothetical protein
MKYFFVYYVNSLSEGGGNAKVRFVLTVPREFEYLLADTDSGITMCISRMVVDSVDSAIQYCDHLYRYQSRRHLQLGN